MVSNLTIRETAFYEFSRIKDPDTRKMLETAFYMGAVFMEQAIREREKREGGIEALTQKKALN